MHQQFADDKRIAKDIFEKLKNNNVFGAIEEILKLFYIDL
jgi:hypothetical protein